MNDNGIPVQSMAEIGFFGSGESQFHRPGRFGNAASSLARFEAELRPLEKFALFSALS